MAERYIDKKIKILELICENDFRANDVSNYGLEITDDELTKIVEEFQLFNLLKIQQLQIITDTDNPREISQNYDDIDIIYQIINKDKLAKLLLIFKEKYPRRNKPIIREKTLEKISKHFGDMATGLEIVALLKEWGVPSSLIEYPNTKWRMIFSVLNYYSVSAKKEDYYIFARIIEEIVHPLMFDGNKEDAQKVVDKFNSFLEYDNFVIQDGSLWQGQDDGSGDIVWNDKNAVSFEPPCYLVLPDKMSELYVHWNELIKLTKFYFSDKNNQDDEINNIYFEIIAKIEESLNNDGCGNLKYQYAKPFINMVGCEFQIQKQGLNSDSLFVNLYDFLGKITELSLPDKNYVEKIKKENTDLLKKIDAYKNNKLSKKEAELKNTAKIDTIFNLKISEMPELKIKGISEESKKNIKKINLANVKIGFNDNETKITAGKINCPLPPFKNEHFFCRSMFKRLPREFIDWSIVYKEMENTEPTDKSKNKRAIQDTMYAVNNRIKDILHTDDDLFTWKEKSVTRNY